MSDNAVKVVQEVSFVAVMSAYMYFLYKMFGGSK